MVTDRSRLTEGAKKRVGLGRGREDVLIRAADGGKEDTQPCEMKMSDEGRRSGEDGDPGSGGGMSIKEAVGSGTDIEGGLKWAGPF